MLYDELDGVKDGMVGIPDPTSLTEFWSKISVQDISHNEGASWIGNVERELRGKPLQNDMNVTVLDVKTVVGKMLNWKEREPDFPQGFWFKKLAGLHTGLLFQLQDCLNKENEPEWMVRR